MLQQLLPLPTSHFVAFPPVGVTDSLEQFIAGATKRKGSRVGRAALARMTPFARTLVEHLSSSNHRSLRKVQTLPRVTPVHHSSYDLALSKVLAFAVLSRFDEYVQAERERLGIRRQYVNGTGIDLMTAIRDAWLTNGDDALVVVIAGEAFHYLAMVPNIADFEVAIRARLADFKKLG
jgi:hypothetical protein